MIHSRYYPWSDEAGLKRNTVYRDREIGTPPSTLYVHYIDRRLGRFPAYRFRMGEPIANIQKAVDDAVKAIRGATASKAPVLPDGSVGWEERSLIAFVLTPRQGRLIEGDGIRMWHKPSKKNHSFFNGQDLEDVSGCSAVCCINHWKGQDGNDLREWEPYDFYINHGHSLIKSFFRAFYAHENSGTNMGP